MAEYLHPHWKGEDPKRFKSNVAKYEIHEPEQDAYGDWAAISSVVSITFFATFTLPTREFGSPVTSSSIDKPFSFCEIGRPLDPDIGFAEGRFYLVTQPPTITKPWPWVEKVGPSWRRYRQGRQGQQLDQGAKPGKL